MLNVSHKLQSKATYQTNDLYPLPTPPRVLECLCNVTLWKLLFLQFTVNWVSRHSHFVECATFYFDSDRRKRNSILGLHNSKLQQWSFYLPTEATLYSIGLLLLSGVSQSSQTLYLQWLLIFGYYSDNQLNYCVANTGVIHDVIISNLVLILTSQWVFIAHIFQLEKLLCD